MVISSSSNLKSGVMRLLIVTHDAFRFYIGSFLVKCDRNDVITLYGGDVRANLQVRADTTVAIGKGQTFTANAFVLQNAHNFLINGTVIAQSVILKNCGNIKGGTGKVVCTTDTLRKILNL